MLADLFCGGAGGAPVAAPGAVRCPECEVVPEELHDEGGVLVALLVQGVQFRDGVVEGLKKRRDTIPTLHLNSTMYRDRLKSWYSRNRILWLPPCDKNRIL